jgi:hypothetical protein
MKRITCACHRINTVFNQKYVATNYGADAVQLLQELYQLVTACKELVEYFKRASLMKQLKTSLKQQVPTSPKI